MVTFTLETPITVYPTGDLANPVTVSSLVITGVEYSANPKVGPLGSEVLVITLSDPVSGWPYKISYCDAAAGDVWGDLGGQFAQQVFDKLIADAKIPAGSYASDQTVQAGKTTQLQGMATQGGASSNFKGL